MHSKIKYSYLCRRCSGFWSYQVCYSRLVINLGSNKKSVQMDIFFVRIYFLYIILKKCNEINQLHDWKNRQRKIKEFRSHFGNSSSEKFISGTVCEYLQLLQPAVFIFSSHFFELIFYLLKKCLIQAVCKSRI